MAVSWFVQRVGILLIALATLTAIFVSAGATAEGVEYEPGIFDLNMKDGNGLSPILNGDATAVHLTETDASAPFWNSCSRNSPGSEQDVGTWEVGFVQPGFSLNGTAEVTMFAMHNDDECADASSTNNRFNFTLEVGSGGESYSGEVNGASLDSNSPREISASFDVTNVSIPDNAPLKLVIRWQGDYDMELSFGSGDYPARVQMEGDPLSIRQLSTHSGGFQLFYSDSLRAGQTNVYFDVQVNGAPAVVDRISESSIDFSDKLGKNDKVEGWLAYNPLQSQETMIKFSWIVSEEDISSSGVTIPIWIVVTCFVLIVILSLVSWAARIAGIGFFGGRVRFGGGRRRRGGGLRIDF